MDNGDDHDVGYGRPPVSTRFGQPGGNSRGKGRPKGSRNLSSLVSEALSKEITVKDGGKRPRKITKMNASLTQLANAAATGNLRAIQMVIELARGVEAKEEGSAAEIELTEADRRALDLLIRRVDGQFGGGTDE